ncbi:hypothetical protein EKO27_g7030 [Xylaria grammica]|uniref:Uncharacterized protein n=1 Tax=Xylaria grammica TaxID=363999 RepID=A0A439D0U7_9PEZI|nr:hypothetical protein EKO27_g7030 [Xylaria grammica]
MPPPANSEGPWDAWYRDVGYVPPLDEYTIRLLEQTISNPDTGRINPTDPDKFQEGLWERNVALRPSTDPYVQTINSLTHNDARVRRAQEEEIHNLAWRLDLERSQSAPDELVFQRTIMMSMINRHALMNSGRKGIQPVFDFAVEMPWTCPPMPTRVSSDAQSRGKFLTQPQPDLAIAFRRDILFPKLWHLVPPGLRDIICYEGQGESKTTRAFHFLAIESKPSYKATNDQVALSRCLNNASQSLHNLYEFFKEAGEEHVEVFFSKVRFFSAVPTTQGIRIRVHRACRAVDPRREGSQSPAAGPPDYSVPKPPIFADYPLQFEYSDCFEAHGAEFSHKHIVGIFDRIIIGYGMKVLLECLKKAAAVVAAKCQRYFMKHDERLPRARGFYSHGQMPPPAEPTARLANPPPPANPVAVETPSTTLKRPRDESSQNDSERASRIKRTSLGARVLRTASGSSRATGYCFQRPRID